LGSTWPPIRWVPEALSPGKKLSVKGVKLTTHLLLAPRSRMAELHLNPYMPSWHSIVQLREKKEKRWNEIGDKGIMNVYFEVQIKRTVFSLFSLVSKNKSRLMRSPCCLCFCMFTPSNNFSMPEPICIFKR
jgi:hypothetical protein